jgi:integrase
MARIKDYADLFALDGNWRKKRAEKKIYFTGKSLLTRTAIMKNYAVPLWGGVNPRKLTVKMIDTSMEGITSELTKRPLVGATQNRILSVLSELYVHLIEDDKAEINPVLNVTRCRSQPEHPRGAVSIAMMKRLFPVNHDGMRKLYISQKYICAFLVLRDTGLRPGELIALRWRDWYPELRFFSIMRAIESGTRTHEKGTKTGATKPGMVTPQAAEEMERLQKKIKPQPEQFIFANYKGIPYDTHRLNWAFRRAVRLAEIGREDLTPYWLRHTFNTRALETLPDEVVRRLMGTARKR